MKSKYLIIAMLLLVVAFAACWSSFRTSAPNRASTIPAKELKRDAASETPANESLAAQIPLPKAQRSNLVFGERDPYAGADVLAETPPENLGHGRVRRTKIINSVKSKYHLLRVEET